MGTSGVWYKGLCNKSCSLGFVIHSLVSAVFISPSDAKHRSNPCREDFGARIEFGEGGYGTDRRSVEFADIREKSPPRGPSLDQGTSAELDRSNRATPPILQIIVPP